MNRYTHIFQALICALFVPLLGACDSVIYDEMEECNAEFVLNFRYDYNMKFADAFAHEVKSVRLYAFDATTGSLVWETTESGARLQQPDYGIELPLPAGKYKLQAWCGADNNPGNEHFTIARETQGKVSQAEQSTCRLDRLYDNGVAVCDSNLHALFYGSLDIEIPEVVDEHVNIHYTMPLIKDTNRVRVVLQHLSGEDLNTDDFEFKIEDSNGSMDCANNLVPDETIKYKPWATYSGVAGVEIKDPSRAESGTITQVKVALAEIDIPRMTVAHKNEMYLTITNRENGNVVASIPLIDYALLVKGFERGGMTDQEYLDRQDEYSLVFFLDQNGQWLASQIIINSWRVVLQNHEL